MPVEKRRLGLKISRLFKINRWQRELWVQPRPFRLLHSIEESQLVLPYMTFTQTSWSTKKRSREQLSMMTTWRPIPNLETNKVTSIELKDFTKNSIKIFLKLKIANKCNKDKNLITTLNLKNSNLTSITLQWSCIRWASYNQSSLTSKRTNSTTFTPSSNAVRVTRSSLRTFKTYSWLFTVKEMRTSRLKMTLIILSGMKLESMMKIQVFSIFAMVSINTSRTTLRSLDSTGSIKGKLIRLVVMHTRECLYNPSISLIYQQWLSSWLKRGDKSCTMLLLTTRLMLLPYYSILIMSKVIFIGWKW